ncbi:MAG TPA: hypothetical protein HPP94_10790 [Desulfuromonadales bacterium]|nr:hypothetical protein [Desulfuromonadales bacterium]
MDAISSTYGASAAGTYAAQLRVSRQKSAAAPTSVGSQQNQDPQIQAQVAQLKSIEEKVKAHEAAHKSAGGAITGAVSYSYTQGPDGRSYITGGEVPISVSPGKTPQETINRMEQVVRAALAPSDPSSQDRAVAAQAAAQQQEARMQQAAEASGGDGSTNPAAASSSSSANSSAATQEAGTGPATAGRSDAGNRSRGDASVDPLVARYSQKAYRDPASNGRLEPPPEPLRNEPQITATSLSGVINSSAAILTPAAITGFGATRPISFHA